MVFSFQIFAPWTVYIYFFTTLLSSQFLDPAKGYERNKIDLYVPFFTVCRFFVYFAVLKVRLISFFELFELARVGCIKLTNRPRASANKLPNLRTPRRFVSYRIDNINEQK